MNSQASYGGLLEVNRLLHGSFAVTLCPLVNKVDTGPHMRTTLDDVSTSGTVCTASTHSFYRYRSPHRPIWWEMVMTTQFSQEYVMICSTVLLSHERDLCIPNFKSI